MATTRACVTKTFKDLELKRAPPWGLMFYRGSFNFAYVFDCLTMARHPITMLFVSKPVQALFLSERKILQGIKVLRPGVAWFVPRWRYRYLVEVPVNYEPPKIGDCLHLSYSQSKRGVKNSKEE